MFLRPFGLYCSACFGSLFVSILCTCCSHFSWYCFISLTMFCAPVFCLTQWFFSLSSFVIPSKCLKNLHNLYHQKFVPCHFSPKFTSPAPFSWDKYDQFIGINFLISEFTENCALLSYYAAKKKITQSHYRPGVPGGFQEVKVPRLRDNGPGWW